MGLGKGPNHLVSSLYLGGLLLLATTNLHPLSFAHSKLRHPSRGNTCALRVMVCFSHFDGQEAFAMNKLLLGAAFSLLISLPVLAALKVGDKAPDFSARGSMGGKEFDFSLQEALKKGPVVVYFFPSAYTKGCDLEAH